MTKHTKKEQKEAQKRVNEITKEIQKLVAEAEGLCDEHGIFNFSSVPHEYGMGGTYRPNPKNVESWAGKPEDYESEGISTKDYDGEEQGDYGYEDARYENYGDGEGYWHTSSMSC